uniref:3-oxo-5-alpha-steroid 4-dehydrogenase C-terminal domain-containing protein n=1 Tax=Brassica oleracea var. oleracea TaxID=109376 RepID=A0A0D3E315_BRAOL
MTPDTMQQFPKTGKGGRAECGGTDATIWLLFGFVVWNLTLAAGETHRWYLRKFENYPANRNAIFPFVY